jgi:putative membrane protein
MKEKRSSVNIMVVLAVLGSVLLAGGSAYAQQGGFSSWGPGPWMMGGYGMGWFGSILMIAFWVLILAGLFFLIKSLVRGSRGYLGDVRGAGGASAREILEARYARGEIDREEFEQKKRDLMG